MVESLAAVWNGHARGPGITMHRLRDLSDEESGQSKRDAALLANVGPASPLASLVHAQADLQERGDAFVTGSRQDRDRASARLQNAFKAWLSAFRSFDDRTCAWLSTEFGKEHPAYVKFKQALNAEFDASFGYRLSCALRNVSEHAGDVITDLSRSEHKAPDGSVQRQARVSLDGPQIARRFGKKMRAATRDELADAATPIGIQALVAVTMLSCDHAFCVLIDALGQNIQGTADRVRSFDGEARHHRPDADAAFLDTSTFDELNLGTIGLRENPLGLAVLAEENLKAARSKVSQYVAPVYGPADLR
ncbi:MAG: hypothetical protein JWR52_3484 [Marmoricola sp.]|nr:hypothetical protein [Marmoricola sp.]